jgi:YebC/PmpR family DNA-binding regulatory protein
MSGHSKWHNIRVKKTAADSARGKVYTRHAKLVEIAAQRGGDPDMNPSLRTAIDNAKADNVPNANIDRAIQKGTGALKGDRMQEEIYAGMGPGNTAILIECLTDNKNRTLSSVRMILTKHGATFAESSSILWMFQRKGVVIAKMPTATSQQPQALDELELALIDFGAEDFEQDADTLTVTTGMADWSQVREMLKDNGFEILSAGLKYVPTQKADITDADTARKLLRLIDLLEEDDDVSEVFANAEIGEGVAGEMGEG